mgnify:CR=1 FL=1
MPSLEELVQPGRAAILTMEMQRAVVGDLTSLRALADVIAEQGVPARLGGLVESARRAEVPVIHCRAAFAADRRGSYRNVPMVNYLLKNPEHMILGEPSTEVIPELGPEPGDLDCVRLHGMSPFTGDRPRSQAPVPRRGYGDRDGRFPERGYSRAGHRGH